MFNSITDPTQGTVLKKLSGVLVSKKEIAEGVLLIGIKFEENFSFIAGQYIKLTLPKLIKEDARGNSRDFSVASPPYLKDKIYIASRISNSGFKQTLLNMELGGSVFVEGPFGSFIMPENCDQAITFIAGGIGITPFRSMVLDAFKENTFCLFTLIYVNNFEGNAPFIEEFRKLATNKNNFSFYEYRARLNEEFLRKIITNADNLFYIAGPPKMVFAIRQDLINLGIQDKNIRVDEFIGY